MTREGNGTFLYSALLSAAGVDHEIVWSRAIPPESDPEPDPAFVDLERWNNVPFVLVRPSDGPEAWCDMSKKTLPYGEIVRDTSRAPAFATKSKKWIEMPEVPLA